MGFLINSWVLILFLLLATAIYIGVAVTMGVMVYRDAKARGMEPWLWTLISVFAPFFIGLLVYLAVRSGKKPGLVGLPGGALRQKARNNLPQLQRAGAAGLPVLSPMRRPAEAFGRRFERG